MANIELDGVNKKIKVDSGDLTLDVPGDIVLDADGGDVVFADGGTNLLKVTNSSSDVVLQPQVDTKDIVFKQYDGTVVATVEDNATFNIPASKLAIGGTAVTSTAAELNILDGVTSTAAELNIVDGNTSATSTTIADADRVVLNDNGTMVQAAVTDLKTYIGGFSVSSITGATELAAEPATTDEFVISDAGTLKRIDYSHIRGSEVLLATATRTSGSASQVNLDDFMDNNKYLFYRAIVVAKNAGNGNSQFFNFTAAGGGTMEESSWHAAVNQVKNSGGTVSNNTGDGADGSNKMTWVTNESTRAFSVEFIMTPYGLVTDMGLSSVHFIGQSDRWTGSAREVQCITGAGYYLESTVPKGFVIGAVGGNWERYEIRVYGHKKV
ncbi:hypothetical protein OAH58_00655 [bacterium]|nr:hypothetical protein [bacterium]